MASNTGIEQRLPPIYDIKSPLDLAKLNPAGSDIPEIKEAQDKAFKSVEDLAASLEQRYAQPNWFKVAAGFAKPQLGGFLASLGSASEALGEQQEAQRAIMPTIARMRSEVAAGQLGLTQRTVQQKKFEEWQASGSKDMKLLGQIYNLDPNSPTAAAIKAQIDLGSTAQTTGAREQELMRTEPLYIPMDKDLQKTWQQHAGPINANLKRIVLESGAFSADQVAAMDPARLRDAFDEVAKQQAEKRITDAVESGKVLTANMTNLSTLAEARELATSKDMNKLLGIGQGQNAVSALFGYLANSDQGSYTKLQAAAAKLAESNPDVYANFLVLQKALNTSVVQARQNMKDNTDLSTSLLQSVYPNVLMPQKAIINLLDLMAAQNVNDSQLAALRQSPVYRDKNPNVFESSEDFKRIKGDLKNKKDRILEGTYYPSRLPSDLYSYSTIFDAVQQPRRDQTQERGPAIVSRSQAVPAPAPAAPARVAAPAPAPAAAPAASARSSAPSSGSIRELARRLREQGNP